jgi:SAM-dependent methyltransferase
MTKANQGITVKLAKAVLKMFPVDPDVKSGSQTTGRSLERSRIEYTDEVCGGFLSHFHDSRASIIGKHVLDLGSGYGGRPVRYAELGAESVVGVEISDVMNKVASDFAAEKGLGNIRFVTAVGEHLPFSDDTFDTITSYDVLEHVQYPAETLKECFRVLRKGGRMLAVFPPYYSIYGAHLYGYISMFPYVNLLFSTQTLLAAIDQSLEEIGTAYRPMPLRPGDKLYTINGLTVKGFRRAVLRSGFSILNLSLAPVNMPAFSRDMLHDARLFFMKTAGFPLAVSSRIFRRLPVLQEVLTARIVCLLVKNDGRTGDESGTRK